MVSSRYALQFALKQFGFVALTVAYTVAGAFFFQLLEKGHVSESRDCLVDRLRQTALVGLRDISVSVDQKAFISDKTLEAEMQGWIAKADPILAAYQKELFKAISYGWDGFYKDSKEVKDTWPFSDAVLYSATVVTTIGYGNIAPKTPQGKIGTIVYALVGIPVTLICLAVIGNAQGKLLRALWRGLRNFFISVFPTALQNCRPDPSEELDDVIVPVPATITIIVFYLFCGALLFHVIEGWPVVSAIYFCFITLSTIGFGDFVPGTKFNDTGKAAKMMIGGLYILIGLALLSTCFQLMLETLISTVQRWAKKWKIVS